MFVCEFPRRFLVVDLLLLFFCFVFIVPFLFCFCLFVVFVVVLFGLHCCVFKWHCTLTAIHLHGQTLK